MKHKNLFVMAILLSVNSLSFANDIYIEQIGDNLNLDIQQRGQDNTIGNSSTDSVLEGSDMTFSISQIGDSNVITAAIRGNTYTGSWAIDGSSNDINMTCDSTSATNCENVTANITINGSLSDLDIFIGGTADSQDLLANITIDGDNNILEMSVDGASASTTIDIDNSLGTLGNTVKVDIDGDGDIDGHTLVIDHTGENGAIDVTQRGIYDTTVDIKTSGDNADIDIYQDDTSAGGLYVSP